jgi:hypothetical protein
MKGYMRLVEPTIPHPLTPEVEYLLFPLHPEVTKFNLQRTLRSLVRSGCQGTHVQNPAILLLAKNPTNLPQWQPFLDTSIITQNELMDPNVSPFLGYFECNTLTFWGYHRVQTHIGKPITSDSAQVRLSSVEFNTGLDPLAVRSCGVRCLAWHKDDAGLVVEILPLSREGDTSRNKGLEWARDGMDIGNCQNE